MEARKQKKGDEKREKRKTKKRREKKLRAALTSNFLRSFVTMRCRNEWRRAD